MGTSASVLSPGFGTLQGGNSFIWLLVGWCVLGSESGRWDHSGLVAGYESEV